MCILKLFYFVGIFVVVNCVQSYLFDCVIVISGIDNIIKVVSIYVMLVELVFFFFSVDIVFDILFFIEMVCNFEFFF